MKKILLLLILFLCFGLSASANWDSALNKVNNILNTVDRTEYTIKRTKDSIQKYNPNKDADTQQAKKVQQYSNQQTDYYSNQNSYGKPYNNNEETVKYSQQQYIPEGSKYNQDRIYKGQASTLGELPAGAIVMDHKSVWDYRNGANYSGEIEISHPVLWRKLEDNHMSTVQPCYCQK